MKKLLMALFLLVSWQVQALAQVVPVPSVWQNQRGSILEIYSEANGILHGQFTNRAPDFPCALGVSYPIVGSVKPANVILFAVQFSQCNTITGWQGYVANPTVVMTNWNLIFIQSDGTLGRRAGQDSFRRIR